VFGWISSGRDPEVEGALTTIGNFLNTVRVHVAVDNNLDCVAWLRKLQWSQIKAREYHYPPLEDIICETRSSRLFETVLIIENQPNEVGHFMSDSLKMDRIYSKEFSDVPLPLVVDIARGDIKLTLKLDQNIFPAQQGESILVRYNAIVFNILKQVPTQSLARLGHTSKPLMFTTYSLL
jgi:hypothetical protein